MNAGIKKAGSVFVLSTYLTSIAIAGTFFVGNEALSYFNSKKDIEHLIDTTENIQSQIGLLFAFNNDIKTSMARDDEKTRQIELRMIELENRFIAVHLMKEKKK